MTTTLLLMRHGKSDWGVDTESDHDRPLNPRGARSSRLMGRVLDAQSLVPDLVISSTAVRARRSAELAMEAGGWACDMILDKALYDSGPEGVLEVAAAHGEMARLMLVGHEPTWSILVRVLTGERVEMKTSSVAVVDVASALPGMSLTPGQGELSRLLHPRSYFGSEWDVT